MGKNKYDFIQDLLTNKKLSPSQREKVLKLTAGEIKKDKDLGIALEERVRILEGKTKPNFKKQNKSENDKFIMNSSNSQKKSPTPPEPPRHNRKDSPPEPPGYDGQDGPPEPPEGLVPVSFEMLNGKIKVKKQSALLTASDKKLPNYFDPKHLNKFLFDYNQNEVLKLTCHDIDSDEIALLNSLCTSEDYNFKKHLDLILKTFSEFEKKPAPQSIKNMIRGYLKGEDFSGKPLKKGWSSDSIEMNWSHPKLRDWTKEMENKGLPPNLNEDILGEKESLGFEFPEFSSKITGKPVQNFTQLVLHFKHLFHLRRNNSLKKIIIERNKRHAWDDKIEFIIKEKDFNERIEFFTDIDKVIQAYYDLIKLALENNDSENKPIIKLSFVEQKSRLIFSVHHLNSTYSKSVESTIQRTGKTYNKLIHKLNGVCNIHLLADFGNEGGAHINIWDSKPRSCKKMGTNVKGVQHFLEFKK